MIDPRAREVSQEYSWGFPEMPLLGGVRPGDVTRHTIRPPGWMLGEGWAVTAEVGGQTERGGAGPHRRPAVAWVRSRPGPATLMIGGRNLGQPGGPSTRISIALRDAGAGAIDAFDAAPGFFFRTIALPAGALEGEAGYLPLEVTAASGEGEPVRVGLEQFDLQSPGMPMVGVSRGWQEPEYNPTTGRTWRWMSDDAELWVKPVGRDVTLRIDGRITAALLRRGADDPGLGGRHGPDRGET